MTMDIGPSAPLTGTPTFTHRRRLHLGIAIALVAGVLAATSVADARTTKIEILSRGIAFGGYAFNGVGQYEKIIGIATGEVNPNDPKNAVIVDIQLAPKLPNGNVQYRHNFYILKPVNLGLGNHKMMYEPPNRGGKTYGTLNRSPGGNDPGAITDPVALANSFLWPRGYTTVWTGWENNLGALTGLTATAELPIARDAGGATIAGPAYEYIVTGGSSFALTYPAASLSQAATLFEQLVAADREDAFMAGKLVETYVDLGETEIDVTAAQLAQTAYVAGSGTDWMFRLIVAGGLRNSDTP